MSECNICFRHCNIGESKLGFCMARTCREGRIIPESYGKISSIALDPIEKKPLNNFFPGSNILSVGSYGCNLRCPFCQNSDISYSESVESVRQNAEYMSPDELASLALSLQNKGNIGVAYTYNEPLVGYEYVRDTAKLVHSLGMKNVMVTNGCATSEIARGLIPYIDAMNIDLKCFDEATYRDTLGGDLEMICTFIETVAFSCHIEVTYLVVPGINDSEDEFLKAVGFLKSVCHKAGKDIPLHITRFFPRFKMKDASPTPISTIYRFVDLARGHLRYVYAGNC